MSNQNGTNDRIPIGGRDLLWGIVAMFLGVLAAAVTLAVALPDSQNPAALVGQLLAAFALLVTAIAGLFTAARARADLQQVKEDTAEIREATNGKLTQAVEQAHSRARAALVQVLEERVDADGKTTGPRNKAYAGGLAPKPGKHALTGHPQRV